MPLLLPNGPFDLRVSFRRNTTDTSRINHLVVNDVTRASVAPITVTSATPPVAPVGMTQRRDWIREGVQTRDIDRASQRNNDARIGLIPKPQVPPFEGDKKGIIQFPAFSAHFKYFVHDVLSCEPTKLSILRAYLPATVQEEIGESVLNNSHNYWTVLRDLDRRYNRPHLVAEYYLQVFHCFKNGDGGTSSSQSTFWSQVCCMFCLASKVTGTRNSDFLKTVQ